VAAKIDDVTGYIVLEASDAPQFKRIFGAIGWADVHHDTAEHFILIGGETRDKRLVFFREFGGTFEAVTREAINLKDRFLMSELWIDIRERDLHIQLALADGLTHYQSLGVDHFDHEIWLHDSGHWPDYRNRETLCTLVAVPDVVFRSAMEGMDRVFRLVETKQLSFHGSCTTSLWVLDQYRAADVLYHPLAKAMRYLAYALEPKPEMGEKWEPPKSPYQNLKP